MTRLEESIERLREYLPREKDKKRRAVFRKLLRIARVVRSIEAGHPVSAERVEAALTDALIVGLMSDKYESLSIFDRAARKASIALFAYASYLRESAEE